MQDILLTEQSFRKIREATGLYIDKTEHIYHVLSKDAYYFIARPRRFGKSLLCSTLAELFAGNRGLFKDLWIDSSDWQWEKYPVIHLDMTGGISSTGDAQEVRKKLMLMITLLAAEYNIDVNQAPDPGTALQLLILGIQKGLNKPVVLIIDEYDKPLLDAIDKTDRYAAIHDEIRTFYSPLKSLAPALKLVFITGVFKFAKTSIFSGFNNLNDITFDIPAAEICGYTEQEIKTFFAEHLAALAAKANVSEDQMMITLQSQYNGYRFGLDSLAKKLSDSVYNPYGLNYVFAKQDLLHKWFASGSPTVLIKKLSANNFTSLETSGLSIPFSMLDESCTPDDLALHENFSETHNTDQELASITLLYYAGYLTIQQYHDGDIFLGFPNQEVATAFSGALLPVILNQTATTMIKIMRKIGNVFKEQRLNDLKELLNDALSPVSYHTLKQASGNTRSTIIPENFYHFGFYFLFSGSNVKTTTEETSLGGRADLVVETTQAVYLFEFKMDTPADDGIKQIKSREYARKFKHAGKQLYAIGISASSEKRFIKELAWEQLM